MQQNAPSPKSFRLVYSPFDTSIFPRSFKVRNYLFDLLYVVPLVEVPSYVESQEGDSSSTCLQLPVTGTLGEVKDKFFMHKPAISQK